MAFFIVLGLVLLTVKGNVLHSRTFQVLPVALCLLWTGCTGDGHRTVEVAPAGTDLHIGRLDQDLFHASPENMQAASLKAYAEHGEFYRTYIEDILQGAPLEDPRLTLVLGRFVQDPDWKAVQHAVDSVLRDLEPQREQFQKAFGRLRTLFPDSLTPRVITFNSGFNYGIFPTDSVLGVGVEWFIGKDHPVIGMLAADAFPQYVKERMVPAMLVPSAMKGWLLVHYTRDISGADLLTNLVETGKVMALLDAVLPDTDPTLKFAFTKEQLAWCEANEYMIWKELVGKEKLFSKKTEDIGRLMNDGPFTNGFPHESPGHLGEWIGYRMVNSYLREDPSITFAQLFPIDDPRVILKAYKPR